jgi:hypothetical protein
VKPLRQTLEILNFLLVSQACIPVSSEIKYPLLKKTNYQTMPCSGGIATKNKHGTIPYPTTPVKSEKIGKKFHIFLLNFVFSGIDKVSCSVS